MSEITKVVLYKHGVGYFEREAEVSGNAEVRLGFRADEMNDVLKSLTVFDSAGGTVSSVSYDNQKPISKLLEESSLNIPDHGGGTALLGAIRGASVLVSAGNRMITGQVVGVEDRQVQANGAVATVSRLTVFDEGGALHGFDLHEIGSVRFLDEHLRAELKHLFETLLSATKRDTKNLKLFARGEGDRKLSISYVVECPVWKTSYRMAIAESAEELPYLQGWALVDNPQDEDWKDVSLSLVSGLPISFTHDLYSPRYLKRKEIAVQREAAAGPVMTEAAMLDMAPAPPMASMAMMESDGAFAGGGAAAPRMMRGGSPSRAAKLAASHQVETVTQSVGQLFEYRIDQPVTVLRNQSALVPIVGSPFEGKRKILYNAANREENPFAIVDFKNTTGLTLEGGPLTVFENDVYAGEAMLDTLSPDEERMIPYAVDLSVESKVESEVAERVVLEKMSQGIWTQRTARYSTTRYRFSNKSDKDKDLVIEHPIEQGERVDTPEPMSESRSYWRFSLKLAAKASTELKVRVRSEDQTQQGLTHGHADWVYAILSGARSRVRLSEFIKRVEAVVARLSEVDRAEQVANQAIHSIVADQGRVRENLSKLSQNHDEARLRSRYVGQLEQQEDELARQRQEVKALAARRTEIRKELAALIAEIEFEQTFDDT